MIVPAEVAQLYSYLAPYFDQVERRVEDVVLTYCKANGFAYTTRRKTSESIAEKLEGGRYRKWSDLEDILAWTIVIPLLSEEPKVLTYLDAHFQTVQIKKRGDTQKAPDAFRFDSTRFVGRLRRLPSTEFSNEIYETQFEIQIRSAFEHAWSTTTHTLAYKSNSIDWRTLRLAAQLKASVEQLDALVATFGESVGGISESHWPEVAAKAEIVDLFKHLIRAGSIPAELEPKDWSRFADNLFRVLKEGLRFRSDETVATVQNVLKRLAVAIEKLPADSVPRSVSLCQMSIGILVEAGEIKPPMDRYVFFVTEAMAELYPAIKAFKNKFEFE